MLRTTRITPHLRLSKHPDGYYRDLSGTIWNKFSTGHPVTCQYQLCGRPTDRGFIMLYEPKRVLCAGHFEVHLHDGRRA
jgi:hypothetical protein